MKRQQLHLKAPDNWINDPNGFIYYKGYYHLFYQYFPYEPRWGTMHWGHAVSRDLVTWEHKGIALYPSTYEDRNGCFSGSAIEVNGRLVLVYTGVRYEVVNPVDPHTCLNEQFESAQLMISSEDGFHFDNENGKTVIIPPVTDRQLGHRTHTRDPKIWRGKDAWYLILGSTVEKPCGDASGETPVNTVGDAAGESAGDAAVKSVVEHAEHPYGEVLFYRSEDLHHWAYVNRAWKGPDYGWMWECPDFFETEEGGVLLVSPMGFLKNGEKQQDQAICFPVNFEENTCQMEIPDAYQFTDYGMDLYAPQTTADAEGRRVMAAWIRMPQPTKDRWIGMFCSPRVVERKGNHIYFRMHPNVRAAYSREITHITQASPEGCMAVFDLADGETADIGGFLIKREGNRICTDRSAVYPSFEGAHLLSETPELKEGCTLEVLVDENLIEIYINNGEYVISNAVYGLGKQLQVNGSSSLRLYTANND